MNLVVGTEVPDIGQATGCLAGTACISEGLRLKCAAARVPEIGRVGQPQRVRLAAQRQLRAGFRFKVPYDVPIVHHVVKRKARVLTRRGQDLEESSMRRVVGISIAASIRIAGAQPGLEDAYGGLPAEFTHEAPARCVRAPHDPPWQDAPDQEIEFAGVRRVDNLHVVGAIRGQLNPPMVRRRELPGDGCRSSGLVLRSSM